MVYATSSGLFLFQSPEGVVLTVQPRLDEAGIDSLIMFQSPEGVVLTVQLEDGILFWISHPAFQSPEGVVLTVQLRKGGSNAPKQLCFSPPKG